MTMLILASLAFVGSHFLMSHPLRAALVGRLGETGFSGLYSLVSFATLGWMIFAFLKAPAAAPYWPVGEILWALVTALMLLASILLAGSLVHNPAFPTMGAPSAEPGPAQGVYAITRHPMMWGVALWGFGHIAIFPTPKSLVFAAAMIVLALVGAGLQDAKKARLQPAIWPAWQRRTSFVPFAAMIAGRARFGSLGWVATLGGLAFWLVATWAHRPIAGWPAGIWRWL